MWKLRNNKNKDIMHFDDASTCVAVFEIMKRAGYRMSVIAPDGTTVNWS